MSEIMYPSISILELQNFKTILSNCSDPEYLKSSDCPYDTSTKKLIKSLIPDRVVQATISKAAPPKTKKVRSGGIKTDELEKEFNDLREEIKSLKIDGQSLEPKDRIQVIKTRAMIVEKILDMKERIDNIKKQQNFIATVIQIMEDSLPQDIRLEIIEKLEPFVEEE